MSVMDRVNALAQQKEQQEATKREKSEKQKLKQFSELVYQIDAEVENDPEEVLKTLDKCGRTPEQLQDELSFLAQRRSVAQEIIELRRDDVKAIGAERKVAEAEFQAAKAKYDQQTEAFDHRTRVANRNSSLALEKERWLNETQGKVLPKPAQIGT